MDIIILRRDLRLEDNWVFYQASQNKNSLAIIFIYNTKQINKQKNQYFSQNGFDFLNHALKILSQKININFFIANNDVDVLQAINKQHKIENIYVNQDLTTVAHEREAKIKHFCAKKSINFHSYEDYFAVHPQFIHNNEQSAFKVFKPFYTRYLKQIPYIKSWKYNLSSLKNTLKLKANQFSCPIFKVVKKITLPASPNEVWKQIDKQKDYAQKRNLLAQNTSLISAALKFGLVSLRMVLLTAIEKYGIKSEFVRQLIWKEFYYHYYFYHRYHYVLQGKWPSNIISKYDHWKYDNNLTWLQKWQSGTTGILIIDAAMNQLNTTGYMHNRARMIVASFLVKNLNIDWRYGEKYFASKLYDYDPIINNQSWQWVGFSGLNFQGNIRVFSPSLQAKKYDAQNLYVQKYKPNSKVTPIVNPQKTRQQFLKKWKEFQAK